MESLKFIDWGEIDYALAYNRQLALFEDTIQNKLNHKPSQNTIIYCVHPPVITLGKSGDKHNLLFSKESLEKRGVAYFQTDRGGDITYHGPGQLVGYPILDLESLGLGLKSYIYTLEEAIIALLKEYSIEASRLEGATGVWLDVDSPGKTRKICAIGVRSSRFVTMHGFALNISTNLDYFDLINPCGFIDKGVTSMEKELKQDIDMETIKIKLTQHISSLFQQCLPLK